MERTLAVNAAVKSVETFQSFLQLLASSSSTCYSEKCFVTLVVRLQYVNWALHAGNLRIF